MLDDRVDKFLDRVAARTPTPGGGAVTAIAGALACALARMVAAYSSVHAREGQEEDRIGQIAERFRRADQMLRALAHEDAVAYESLSSAMTARKQKIMEAAEFDAAVREAIAVPLEIAAITSNALSSMRDLAEAAKRALLCDLGAAAVLAQAAASAAQFTVMANANLLSNQAERQRFLEAINEIRVHCDRHASNIKNAVSAYLENAAP